MNVQMLEKKLAEYEAKNTKIKTVDEKMYFDKLSTNDKLNMSWSEQKSSDGLCASNAHLSLLVNIFEHIAYHAFGKIGEFFKEFAVVFVFVINHKQIPFAFEFFDF